MTASFGSESFGKSEGRINDGEAKQYGLSPDRVTWFWPALTGFHPSKIDLPAGKTPGAKPMDPSASVSPAGRRPSIGPIGRSIPPKACQYLLERHGLARDPQQPLTISH
jgi:hypothetical protein